MEDNIFHNFVFVLEFDILTRFKEKQCWRRKITEHGGTISYVFTPKVNYVVLFGDMLEKSSYKQRQAVRHSVPVLRCEFITDCIEQKQILPTATYAVGEPISGKNFKKGRITKQEKTKRYLSARRHVKSVNLNAIKSWSLGDPEAPSHNDDQYEVAKWVLLKSTKVIQVIEVHALTSCDKFRLYHQEGHLDGEHILASEGPVVWYLDTADEVLVCFEQLYKRYTSGMMNMEPWYTPRFVSNQIGSHKLKMTLDDLCLMNSDLDPDVGQFVEMIWKEATQEAEKMLTMSMEHIKSDKVDDAMVILQQIKQMKKENQGDNRLAGLVEEFYNEALPHKQQYITRDLDPQTISQKLDLCQLIYDVLAVSEATDFSPAASTVAKYRALRCHMTKLDLSASKYQVIQNILKDSEQSIAVHSVFEAGRTMEDILFESTAECIGNTQLLMHASGPHNLLGILSRGLLLPQNVVEEHGVNRTDGGKLGYGIYFSNSFNTCLQYAVPSVVTGMRMLVVCEVALGNCMDFTTLQSGITAPPGGYHSCHGVKTTENDPTEFWDDEFVIYSTSQQRVKYVVLFTLPSDPPLRLIQTTPEEEEENMEVTASSVDIMELRDLPDPFSKVTSGLISQNKSVRVPLKAVHIRAKVIDMVAKVVVLQSYKNNMTEPIEAKYVFPLDEKAAVCGFEAFINGKHVIGEIKEKKTAHREYREAISKGHGAYLMDEEEPDVFTVSVGNLPPDSEVLIKVTYISELGVEGDGIALTIPASVAPWVRDTALAQQTQAETSVLQISDLMDCQISLQAAIEMPFEIRELNSGTHRLKYKKTDTKAVVEIPKKSNFAEGFQLLIKLAEIHVPRMWVECHPERDVQACMLAFYPEFEAAIDPSPEVVFLMDLSNSMKGDAFRDSRKVLLLALENLPEKACFNIMTFGSSFRELFQFPHRITKNSTNEAMKYIERANPVMGCSDVLSPLKSLYLLSPAEGSRSIFLISDGFVGNEGLFETVAKHSSKNRLFCMGVGSNRDSHTLRSLANYGGGTYEYFNSKTKSNWQSKIALQMDQATRPGISQVQVEWGPLTDKLDPPLQAPCRIPSLFSANRLVVYGFVKNCTQAILKAKVDEQEFETIVSTTELNFTEGKMLHQLAARAVIRDYEDGVLSDSKLHHKLIKQERKQHIIELSKEFGIVTPYTSFVAIEERTEGETTEGPSIEELVNNESVDNLTYMGWINADNMDEKDPLECVEELLHRASIAESFSQLEVERCYLSVLDYRKDLMQEDNRDMLQKVLERSDKFFSSQHSEKAQTLQQQFHKYLSIPKQLEVRTLTGRSIPVVAGTVAQLKLEIMEKEGLPESSIRLIHHGKLLEDTDNLDMREHSIIFMVQRLRGGAPPPTMHHQASSSPSDTPIYSVTLPVEDLTSDELKSCFKKKKKKKKCLSEKEAEELGFLEKMDKVHTNQKEYQKSLVDQQEGPNVIAEQLNDVGNTTGVSITAVLNESDLDNVEFDIDVTQKENEPDEVVQNSSLMELNQILKSTIQSSSASKKRGYSLRATLIPTIHTNSFTPPAFSPASPAYGSTSAGFCPTSPAYSPTSPAYNPTISQTYFSTTEAVSQTVPPQSFTGNIDQKADEEYSDGDIHVESDSEDDDFEVDDDRGSSLERRPRPIDKCFDENEDIEENESSVNIIKRYGEQERSNYSEGTGSEKRNRYLQSEDQSFKSSKSPVFKRRGRSRNRKYNSRQEERGVRSCDRSWHRRDRSRDRSWNRRDRNSDRSKESSTKNMDRSWNSITRSRDSSTKSRNRSLDRRSRSRDRSRVTRSRIRDRNWGSISRSRDSSNKSSNRRDRSHDRSFDRRSRSRDRSWDSITRSKDSIIKSKERSLDDLTRSRDRSTKSKEKSLDSITRSRDSSTKSRDKSWDRSRDNRSRSMDRSWDSITRNTDSSTNSRDRSLDSKTKSKDSSTKRRDRSLDRSHDRNFDRRSRSRDRSWDILTRSIDRSLDRRSRSRDRIRVTRSRIRDRNWDSITRSRESSTKSRNRKDRSHYRTFDRRSRSGDRSWNSITRSRDSSTKSRNNSSRRRDRSCDSITRSRDSSTNSRDRSLGSKTKSKDNSPKRRDRSLGRRDRSRVRNCDSITRSRNSSLGRRDRSRDMNLDSRTSSRDKRSSRDSSRDCSAKSRDRSLDRRDRKCDRSLDSRTRSRDRSRDTRTRSRDRSRDTRTKSRDWSRYRRDRSYDRSWDRRDRSRDRSWNRRDRSYDGNYTRKSRSTDRSWESRDRSWDRENKRRERRDRSRDRCMDSSRDKCWDRRDRRCDRSWDGRTRSRDRSRDIRTRSRVRSRDTRTKSRDWSWYRRDRSYDRSWDRRDRSRDRSWESRDGSRNRSWDRENRRRDRRDRRRDQSWGRRDRSRNKSWDSRVRSRNKSWDERENRRDRNIYRKSKRRDWNWESSKMGSDRSWDRDRSIKDRRNNFYGKKTRGRKRKISKKSDDSKMPQRTEEPYNLKGTQFELELSEEELLNSLCLYESQFEAPVGNGDIEVHCWTGNLHYQKISTRENIMYEIDVYVNPQRKERVQNVLLPETLYMTFVPSYLLRMLSLQQFLENAVQATMEVQDAPEEFLPIGLIGCIQIEEPKGHFELVLAIPHSMSETILFLIPEDGKAVAEQLEEFVKEHKMQVKENRNKLNETLSTDAPYIDMWKSVWDKDGTMNFRYLPPLNEDGLWRLDKDLAKGLAISAEKLEQLLKNQGLLSLSKSIQSELLPVMATFLVGIMKFMHEFKKRKLPKWLCCCEHLLDISPNISSVVVSFKCMKEVVSIGFDFPLEASIQLGNRKPIWTPYIRDLDLGKNLTHLVDCLLQSLLRM